MLSAARPVMLPASVSYEQRKHVYASRQTMLSYMLSLQELKAEPAAQHQVAHVKQDCSAGPLAWPPQSRQPFSSHQVEASLAALQPTQGQHACSPQSREPPQQQLGLAPQSHQQLQQGQRVYPAVPAWEPRGPAPPYQQGVQPQQQLGRLLSSFPAVQTAHLHIHLRPIAAKHSQQAQPQCQPGMRA